MVLVRHCSDPGRVWATVGICPLGGQRTLPTHGRRATQGAGGGGTPAAPVPALDRHLEGDAQPRCGARSGQPGIAVTRQSVARCGFCAGGLPCQSQRTGVGA